MTGGSRRGDGRPTSTAFVQCLATQCKLRLQRDMTADFISLFCQSQNHTQYFATVKEHHKSD
mgnify:FL=1